VVYFKSSKFNNSWELPVSVFEPFVDIDLFRIFTFLPTHFINGHKPLYKFKVVRKMWLYGHNELTILIAWTKNTYIQCKASFAKDIPNK